MNMKKILCLYILLVFVVTIDAQDKSAALIANSVKPESSADAADRKEILKIIEQWREGYNSGNAAKVAALYKEDACYLTQHYITGIVNGRAEIQAYVQIGVDSKYHIDSIRALSIDCSGDFAYAITRYDATNNGQSAFGVNIVVLKKIGGKWFIVAHEAAVPDPNTSIQHLDTTRSH
jgi:ketosteroid isomerase-like protein